MRKGSHMTEEQRAADSSGRTGLCVGSLNHNWTGGKVHHICLYCGDTFPCYPSGNYKFCSPECYHLAEKGRSPPNKGKPMSDECKAKDRLSHLGNSNALGHHLSEEAKANIGLRNTGQHYALGYHHTDETRAQLSEGTKRQFAVPGAREHQSDLSKKRIGPLCNWRQWKGGITPINHVIRTSNGYIAWRTAVFERDNFTCHDCGERGGHLEAHHIHEFAKHPELRFDVDNGVTLCRACHKKRHVAVRLTRGILSMAARIGS